MPTSTPNAQVLTDAEREFLTRCSLLPAAAHEPFLTLAELPVANDAMQTACMGEHSAV